MKNEKTLEEVGDRKPEPLPYEDDTPVTVIWKSWGTSGLPAGKTTYFDRQTFVGGVSRRVPYRIAKKWQEQGHGILIFDVNATEADFIRATGHKPLEDEKFAMLLRATPPDKLAALLGSDTLDKIMALHRST